jgi:mannosyltransferase
MAPPSEPTRTDRPWRWMPAGVVLAALALGLIRLRAQPLWFDEQVTRDTATLPWSGIWDAARATEAPHLAYYGLLKPWLAVAGESDWALRLLSVLFGALAAGVTALLGRELFSRWAGLVAGLALAAGSFFVSWEQQARGYTLAVLLACLATFAFVRAAVSGRTAWWVAWAAMLAAAGWVSLWAFSVVVAHLAALALMRPRPPLRAPLIGLLCATAALLPQLVLVATGNNGQLDWIPSPTPRRVAVGLWDWASRNPIAVAAATVGLVQLARGVVPRAASWKTALVAVWLAAPLVATLLASIAQPAFEARYVLAATPAMALAIGAGVVSLPRRWALALAIVLAISLAVRLGQHYWSPGDALIRE